MNVSTIRKNLSELFANPALLVMFFFGLSCGFPLALTMSLLKTWLATIGVSIKSIAASALIGIPYSTKVLWAPFLDSVRIPYLHKVLGHRRSWLLVLQLLLGVAILLMAASIYVQEVSYCIAAGVLIAFVSATQDTVVDAYRIQNLPKTLQALGVTSYIYGYRIGLYISGAGLLAVAHAFGWSIAYGIGSVVMGIGIITTLLCREPHKMQKLKDAKLSFVQHFTNIVVTPFKEFASVEGWYHIILFIILFKLGDAVAGNLTQPFLVHKGFSLQELALYLKTYGLVATCIGALIGGVIFKKFGVFQSLLFAGVVQMLSNLMFVYQDYMGHDMLALFLTVFAENTSGAIGDVIFVGYLSSLCSLKFAASQYALFASIAMIARSMLAGFSGVIVDRYGWSTFFIVSAILALPGVLMILKIKNIKRIRA